MATSLPTRIHVAFISVPSQHRECHIAKHGKTETSAPGAETADGPSA
jgi:hypothetical protein